MNNVTNTTFHFVLISIRFDKKGNKKATQTRMWSILGA